MIKELGSTEIDRLLSSEVFGRIGCHARGRTYVVPMTYAFNGSAIIGQTGTGLKVDMMRENPRVCFEIDRVNEDGAWQSVIVQGRYAELHGEEARVALEQLLARLDEVEALNGVTPTHGVGRMVPSREPDAMRPEVVFKIEIDEKTGRSEVVPARIMA